MNVITLFLIIAFINSINSLFIKKQGVFYCGLIGFSGDASFNVDRIKELILCNMSRGVDATGMYNNGAITKDAILAIDFLAKYSLIPENRFLGHCRASTFGNKTDANNAHPFQYDKSILIHNGTLKQLHEIASIVGWKYNDYQVDSQILAKAVSMNKHVDVFKSLDGAVATIWTQEDQPDTIYCYRNAERPLFRGYIKGEGVYLSSLENSLKIIGCESIKEIKTHCIYTIKAGEIVNTSNITIPTKKTTVFNNYSNSYSSYLKTLKCGDFVENISPMGGFTIGQLYKVTTTPMSTDYLVSVINNAGVVVERSAAFFKKAENNIKKDTFVIIVKEQASTSPLSINTILYCKDVEEEGRKRMLYCVDLIDWSKTYIIPDYFCRVCTDDELVLAENRLTNRTKIIMSLLNIQANVKVLGEETYINSQLLIDKLSDIYAKIDDVYNDIADVSGTWSAEIAVDLRHIKVGLEDITKWIDTDSIDIVSEPQIDK